MVLVLAEATGVIAVAGLLVVAFGPKLLVAMFKVVDVTVVSAPVEEEGAMALVEEEDETVLVEEGVGRMVEAAEGSLLLAMILEGAEVLGKGVGVVPSVLLDGV